MFLTKSFLIRTYLWRRNAFSNVMAYNIRPSCNSYSDIIVDKHKYYSTVSTKERCELFANLMLKPNLFPLHRKWCSKRILGASALTEKDLQKITELYPEPRVTLHNYSMKTPEKVLDIHYKQITVAPKGTKKQTPVNNDWTCTYSFVWPEKKKFEGTAISKRKAAEIAASQALHWLYVNKRIDDNAHPMYDKTVLKELNSNLNEAIKISISDKSVERIERIWNDYENGIKSIYDATFEEAQKRSIAVPAVIAKDSTIEEETDDFSGIVDDIIEDSLKQTGAKVHPVYGRIIRPSSDSTLRRRELVLKQRFQRYNESITALPVDAYADQITSALESNRVLVIVGEPGCGKSTRVPAAILRACGIKAAAVVSEPRRVAAIGLAERVASELGEETGESIGYQVRLRAKLPRPPAGSILYCTSGVLLNRLQSNPGLFGCSHVFIDEAHERDVNTDITLLLLKKALALNPALKIVVMSATLDTDVFTRYFGSCPVLEVPGRTYPVQVSYLDDIKRKYNLRLPNTSENSKKEDCRPYVNCDEIVELIKAVDKEEKPGAILVFLPGWAEIKQVQQALDLHYGPSGLHMVLPVHSRLSTADQTKMFSTPPPGIRKIVVSTNVAETSVTIPDVVHVIDSGARRENRLLEGTGIASLETVWVSRAGAKQRAGRAGRVQPGHCYKLYTKEKEDELVPHTTPEILRIPLEQTVLDCKTYAPEIKIQEFLSQLPDPPSDRAIELAVNDLKDLGALSPSEQLTRLGALLSPLRLSPRAASSALLSAVAGGAVCAADVLAHAQCGEIFERAADRRDEIREIKRAHSGTSDQFALHSLQAAFEEELRAGQPDDWCRRHGLRRDRLGFARSLSNHFLELMLKSGVVEPTAAPAELDRFSSVEELTSALFLAGTDSLLITRRYVKSKGKLAAAGGAFTGAGERAHIASESVNYGITKRARKSLVLSYFGGHHSLERRALVVYKTSVIPPHTAVLFCKGHVKVESDEETTILTLTKHRLRIHVPKSQADHLLRTKEMLWNTFQYYIERDVNNLDFDENTAVSRFKVRLFKAIGRILVEGHREYVEGKSRTENIYDIS